MALLFGSEVSREALLERVGDVSQIARVKPYRLVEGFEDQLQAADVTNGSGLEFTVLPGRGMDIGAARYNGRPLAWRSAVGDRHAAFYEPQGDGWLRSFAGGLLVTCGLTWLGASGEDEGQPLGLHGRASSLPASSVHWGGAWIGDEYELTVRGMVREAVVFGENVRLTRTIRTRLGQPAFSIEDVVENMGHRRTPHMILYHINAGWPLLNASSRFHAPSAAVEPRDADAEPGVGDWMRMQPPSQNYKAQVFFHTMRPAEDGSVFVVLESGPASDVAPFGLYIRYNANELPCFTQWKMMDRGAYVLGMEPGNARVMGRDVERREGRLQHLEPGETRCYRLEIGMITDTHGWRTGSDPDRV
ncbi:MAG TPA: aldose 1-epimerase family protein [Chthonomonadaceae bacterium]|nr:aldose 1-epimerase family protein [Chthonomonadaceae bacterium]